MREILALLGLGGFWVAADYFLSYDSEGRTQLPPDCCLNLHKDPVHAEAGCLCWRSAVFLVCSRLWGNASNSTYMAAFVDV